MPIGVLDNRLLLISNGVALLIRGHPDVLCDWNWGTSHDKSPVFTGRELMPCKVPQMRVGILLQIPNSEQGQIFLAVEICRAREA
jgi:hypothetical protein